jgi:hypothetical protein
VAQTQIAALETQINAQYVYLDLKGKLLVSQKFVDILSASTASLNGQRFVQNDPSYPRGYLRVVIFLECQNMSQ